MLLIIVAGWVAWFQTHLMALLDQPLGAGLQR
jgi:hypothetical protein